MDHLNQFEVAVRGRPSAGGPLGPETGQLGSDEPDRSPGGDSSGSGSEAARGRLKKLKPELPAAKKQLEQKTKKKKKRRRDDGRKDRGRRSDPKKKRDRDLKDKPSPSLEEKDRSCRQSRGRKKGRDSGGEG